LRPMRPNPLMPTRTAMTAPLGEVGDGGPPEGDRRDAHRAGVPEGPSGLRQGRAGGEDVVHENQRGTRNAERGTGLPAVVPRSHFRVPRFEGPRHVRQARCRCQRRLRGGLAAPRQQVGAHRQAPAGAERAGEVLALVVSALAPPPGAERDGHEHCARGGRRDVAGDRRSEVVRDARQAAVLERVGRLPCAVVQPHGGAGLGQRGRPLAAQAAGAEVRAGLAAALAPRPHDRSPAVAAHVADDLVGGREAEEVAAEQALRRQKQLLEGARRQVPRPPVYLSLLPPLPDGRGGDSS